MNKSLYQVVAETKTEKNVFLFSVASKVAENQIMNAFENYRKRPGRGRFKLCSNIAYDGIIRLAEIGRKDLSIKYIGLYKKIFDIK